MIKLFSFLKKNKKIIAGFLFLFIYLFGAAPIAFAAEDAESVIAGSTKNLQSCESNLSWYKAIGAAMADILLFLPKQIAKLIVVIASWVTSRVINWPITKALQDPSINDGAAKAFAAGWISMRDVANMLIVLGFVIIGIAFTLRLENYGSKKALVNLIVIALFINFSGIFCGLFIDFSNLAMSGLVKGTPGTMGAKFFADIQNRESIATCTALQNNDLGAYIMADVLFGFIYVLVAICFAYLAVILIARYAYLGILFILAPLAFACWAFPIPKMKDVWNKWWNEFLKWTFIGVSTCLFLNIAGKVLDTMDTSTASSVTELTYRLLVVIIIIIVGIKISADSSGASALAAGAVVGLATGGAGLAMGAVSSVAKGGMKALNERTGGAVSNRTEQVRQGYGRAMERLGLRQTGSTDAAAQDRIKKEATGISVAYQAAEARGDTSTMQRMEASFKRAKGAKAAAYAQGLGEKGMLNAYKTADGKVDYRGLNQSITYAESAGAVGLRKEISKSNPMLAGDNKMSELIEKQAPGEFAKNINHDALTPEVISRMTKDQMQYFLDPKNREKVDYRKRQIIERTATPQTKEYGEMKKYLTSVVKTDPTTAGQGIKHIEYIQTQAEIKSAERLREEGLLQEHEAGEAANAREAAAQTQPSAMYRAGRATRSAIESAKAAPGRMKEGVVSRYEGIKTAGRVAGRWAKGKSASDIFEEEEKKTAGTEQKTEQKKENS